ncbi:MAG: hypothetical protein RR828_00840, partial [Oscillospiraceae bacterium]
MKNFRNKLLSLLAAAALMVTMVPAALALEDDVLEPALQLEVEALADETVTLKVYHFYLDNKEALKDSREGLPAQLAKNSTLITNEYAETLYDADPEASEYKLYNGAHYEVSGHSFHVLDKSASPGSSASEIQIADGEHIDLTNASDVIIHIMYDVVDADAVALDVFHYYGSSSEPLRDKNYPQTIPHNSNGLTDAFAKSLYNTDPSAAVDELVAPLEHGGIYLTSGYNYIVSYNDGATSSIIPVAEAVEDEDPDFLYLAAATNVFIHLSYNVYYPVTATVTGNGTATVTCADIYDNDQSDVNHRLDATVTVNFSANEGHHITTVTDNDVSVDDFSSGELVLNNLDAAHNIVVTTAPDEGTIAPTPDPTPEPTPEPEPNPNPNPPQPVDPQPTAPIDPVVPVLPEEPIVLPENVTPLAPVPEAPVTSTEDGVILIDAETP